MYNLKFIIARFWNWRLVRGVAELQILTRASYFMLVFVPILAGLWPAVRLYVNNHNEAVIQATKVLERYTEEFNESRKELNFIIQKGIDDVPSGLAGKGVSLSKVADEIDNKSKDFSNDVIKFTNDFIPRTLNEPMLPWTWGAAFFASLFAVVAHLLYQLSAPEVLRRFTIDEFVKGKKQDYTQHPSEDAVKRAQEYLGTKEGHTESLLDEERTYRLYKKTQGQISQINYHDYEGLMSAEDVVKKLSLSELSNLLLFIPNNMNLPDSGEILELVNYAYKENSEKIGVSDIEKQRNMAIIERGARAEYLYWASKNMFRAILTTIIYTIAILITLEIIIIQALRVMEASGWNNLFDLVRFSL
ncbi:conserved membrane hypothetical protein [Vibrio chagasii]|nr:conserved membrane hypothetical protein [Vibrio chagasii]CAH7138860.1 conserved membrane hypothetical protein [Vibrio chagasii]CAH7192209.1 conserved membrane hypothetical protein [Vibrio chagasii]